MCNEPVRDVHIMQGLVGIIGCSITFVIFLMRVASNLSLNGICFGWDDYLIAAAMLFTLGASALAPVGETINVNYDWPELTKSSSGLLWSG
jgi:hypothetical protein